MNNEIIRAITDVKIISGTVVFIIGTITGIITGVAIVRYEKNLDEKRTKKYIINAILPEIEENQKFLSLIIGENNIIKESQISFKDIPMIKLSTMYFDRNVYSSLLDKIGLLPTEIIYKLVQYYTKLNRLENIYEGITSPLGLSAIKERMNEQFFEDIDKTYNIGIELIQSLEHMK